MTQRTTLAQIRALGLTARCTDGEFRICVRGYPEAAAYYTHDADDALSTARDMHARSEPQLHRLAQWIRSHAVHAFARDGFVLCGFHAVDRDNVPFTELQHVRSLAQARDALGY